MWSKGLCVWHDLRVTSPPHSPLSKVGHDLHPTTRGLHEPRPPSSRQVAFAHLSLLLITLG